MWRAQRGSSLNNDHGLTVAIAVAALVLPCMGCGNGEVDDAGWTKVPNILPYPGWTGESGGYLNSNCSDVGGDEGEANLANMLAKPSAPNRRIAERVCAEAGLRFAQESRCQWGQAQIKCEKGEPPPKVALKDPCAQPWRDPTSIGVNKAYSGKASADVRVAVPPRARCYVGTVRGEGFAPFGGESSLVAGHADVKISVKQLQSHDPFLAACDEDPLTLAFEVPVGERGNRITRTTITVRDETCDEERTYERGAPQ